MTEIIRTRSTAPASAAALVLGALVAVALGAYGAWHDPTGESIATFGFGSMIAMKVWLALAAGVLALVQLATALWIYGRLGREAPPSVTRAHRVSGAAAVVLSLPVAFHCLWSLGFQTYDTRTLLHSLVGCVLYGALVAKLVVLHGPPTSGWLLPLLGGLVFAALVAVVLTSSLWYLATVGLPSGTGY